MRTLALLTVLLLAGMADAQTLIPLPGYSSTFSNATRTRGFYFQSPVDFTIVGLRVPDEKNHGKQSVAVYKLAAKPPAYPTTASGGLQFVKVAVASSVVIPCQVSFKKNDWVGVLGACGDTTMMHNSYGSAKFSSSVLGQPVTLLRFITQTNLEAQKGNGPYSNEDNGSLSRVEVYVTAATLTGSGAGAPGTTLDFTLMAMADAGLPYQMGSSLGNGPIMIDTRKLELSPDDLLVLSVTGVLPMVFQDYIGILDTTGMARAKLNIPNYPALKGIRIYTAFGTLKASAPSGVSSISNSFLFTIT